MTKKITITKRKNIEKDFKKWKRIPSDKSFLKRRKELKCCKSKKQDECRKKYGTSTCDSYGLSYRLGIIISNNLFQYIADAKPKIERDDWNLIEKYAQYIQDYSDSSNWDLCDKDLQIRNEYLQKEAKFREAMFWLQENWQSLWW
jgi:hypothetical protein